MGQLFTAQTLPERLNLRNNQVIENSGPIMTGFLNTCYFSKSVTYCNILIGSYDSSQIKFRCPSTHTQTCIMINNKNHIPSQHLKCLTDHVSNKGGSMSLMDKTSNKRILTAVKKQKQIQKLLSLAPLLCFQRLYKQK